MKNAVFSGFTADQAANLTYLGLYALQHRGQESAGIASSDGKHLYREKHGQSGGDVPGDRIENLPGHMSIGHNRYSTTGSSSSSTPSLLVDSPRRHRARTTGTW